MRISDWSSDVCSSDLRTILSMSQERFESDRHLSHHRVVVTTFFARSSCHSPQKCMSAKNAVSRRGDTYCRLCTVSGIKYRREPSHPRLRQRSRRGSPLRPCERTSVGQGTRGSVRVDIGGGRGI